MAGRDDEATTPVYFRAPWEYADAAALQALMAGTATPEQQKRALDWVIHAAAFTYQTTFFPGEPDACHFAEGRRFVGNKILTLLKLNLPAIIQAKGENIG